MSSVPLEASVPSAYETQSSATKHTPDHFFDGGWCWMSHPSRNGGNAIPVFMYVEHGERYYKPLDPEDCGELCWDERDDKWEMIVPPLASELVGAAPDLLGSLRKLVDEVEMNAIDGNPASTHWAGMKAARAAIRRATGEQS